MNKKQFIGCIACLGCCGIVTIVLLLVLFLAIIPGLAQDAVDASRIEVTSMRIMDSTPDTMSMVMDFDVWNLFTLGAKLKSADVEIEFDGLKVGTMTMPELELDAHSKTSFSKDLTLVFDDDRTGFNKYAAALMTEPQITMFMKGKVDIVSMGLSYGVNLNSEVKVKGFNNFNSLNGISRRLSDDEMDVVRPVLTSMDFTDDDVPRETVVAFGSSSLPNPSQVEVANSGRMFADVYAFGEKIGTAESTHDVTIKAVGAVVTMRMVIEKSDTNQQAIREMFGNYVNGVETLITIQGTGGTKSEWAEPLKAMRVSIGVPGLVNEQDKMFVGVQQPLNFTAATMLGSGYEPTDVPYVDMEYCTRLFGSAGGKCAQDMNAGALMPVTAVIRNVLGMQVTVSDYLFSAVIASEVPDFCRDDSGKLSTTKCPTLQLDATGGFNISGQDFGFTGKELARAGPYSGPSGHVPAAFQPGYRNKFVEHNDQQTITLASKSMKMMGMSMASAVSPVSPTVSGLIYNYVMPTMMNIHGYEPYGTFFAGHDNVPFFVDMLGQGTMSTKSGFSIDGVKIEQRNVLTFMAFIQSGGDPSTQGPFLAGCPKNSPIAWGECKC